MARAGSWAAARLPHPGRYPRFPWVLFALLVLFGINHLIYTRVHVPAVSQGLAAVRAEGRLVVLTRLGPTTYYEGSTGLSGFEYEMMRSLAKSLGVEVEFRIYDTEPKLLKALGQGKGHIAAAGLALSDERKTAFAAGPEYQKLRQIVACRRGLAPLPRKAEALAGLRVAASAGTPGAVALLAAAVDGVRIVEVAAPAEELLGRVARGDFDCAVADSLVFKVTNPYYPDVAAAFDLTGDQPVAWLLAPGSEDMRDHLRLWLAGTRKSGLFSTLERRLLGFLPLFDYVDLRAFQLAIEERLPLYEKAIRRAARDNDLPWQLLAAIAYQESHWNPEARSPTGVRGFMMLTKQTAEQLGVEDRLDPVESIEAGARYLADLKTRVPVDVLEPDRTWFALAAYNMGLGHLYDARVLAARAGRNKNVWSDLRRVLPQLNDPAAAASLRHGRARGGQAVHFVQQVRTYMHILDGLRSS